MQSANDVLREAHEEHIAGNLPRAEYLYCKLIAHAEDHPVAYFGLGTLYAQAHAHGRAITFLKRAIELQPEGNGAMENLAAVYREMEKRDEARRWGERAIALARTPISLSNMAGTYINDGNPAQALMWAEHALEIAPDLAQAQNHKALALLEMGRFEEGWRWYDGRLNLPGFDKRTYDRPQWRGEKVGRLAIHGEQGLGDEIMFLTCLAQLKDRADEIAIEVNHRLVKLIQASFPDCRVFGSHKELVESFSPDAYVALGSLPGLCWPVKPNAYLKPTKAYPKSRVGLSWKGGTVSTHQSLRNAPIEEWNTFLELGCISLQYGDEKHNAAALGVFHDQAGIADLDVLASMIKSCDVVITVCNTTVHMAGALGVPCVVLVPSSPAWRYGLTGEKMVWYDSPIMVRQAEGEAWEPVFERAKLKAKDILANHRELPRTQFAAA